MKIDTNTQKPNTDGCPELSFICDDCSLQMSRIGSMKLVNKSNNIAKFVCKECRKNYNIRKPN